MKNYNLNFVKIIILILLLKVVLIYIIVLKTLIYHINKNIKILYFVYYN